MPRLSGYVQTMITCLDMSICVCISRQCLDVSTKCLDISRMVFSMAPLHLLGHNDENVAKHDYFQSCNDTGTSIVVM